MPELVSIVIPVYNHEQELQQALASISKQTYKNIEVIIVDDGSDKQIQNSEFRIIRQENRGAPAARNRGLKEAKGEYVIFWDADVLAKPDMLEKLHTALQKNIDASYAYCDYTFGLKKMPARVFDAASLRANNYIHSTSLIRKSDCPTWDESLKRFQDWDLWLTMLAHKKTGIYVPETLFSVIPHKRGMSGWLPRIAYRSPFKWFPGIAGRVKRYERAKQIVENKHSLLGSTRQH